MGGPEYNRGWSIHLPPGPTIDEEIEPHPEWQVDRIVDCRETRRLPRPSV